jgi:hypothetical protein
VGLPGSLFGETFTGDWETQEISFPAAGLTSAVLDIEIGPPGAKMFALEDSPELIAGTVTYNGDLTYHNQGSNGLATVTIAPHNFGGWIWEPGQWDSLQTDARWSLGLNPGVPLSLNLTALAGTSQIDLRDLLLQDLSLIVSAGEITLFLPGGSYNVDMETNAAATTLTLPQNGRQTIDLSVNAGSVTIILPEGVEARIEMDQALGSFNSQDGRLKRIGDSNVWQTNGYDRSSDRIDLNLHIAVGSVTVH